MDPYTDPASGCLRNALGITDPGELREVEARLASLRDVQLARNPLPGAYDLPHLRHFHRRLFGDVYPWAGEVRTVNISKDGLMFANHLYVSDAVGKLLTSLEIEDHLQHLPRPAFISRLAYYYGELNACHPFREGNGRTQRAFFRQLAAAAGWPLSWSALSQEESLAAARDNLLTTSTEKLVSLLDRAVAS